MLFGFILLLYSCVTGLVGYRLFRDQASRFNLENTGLLLLMLLLLQSLDSPALLKSILTTVSLLQLLLLSVLYFRLRRESGRGR